MLKVEFDTLHRNYTIFKIEKYNILCFLDTGANIPIWNGSIDLFLDTFKNCNPVKTGLLSQKAVDYFDKKYSKTHTVY